MTIQQLTSKENPILKSFRMIAAGTRRAPKDTVVAEGLRVLEEAEQSGCEIEAVVCSDTFGLVRREKELIDRLEARNFRLYRVDSRLYQSISTVRNPQGVIALVVVPDVGLDSVQPAQNPLILCACGIQDPGNLGTLIRTAAAAEASMVYATPGTVSARNPKTIRSSAGACFRLPIVEHADFSEFRRYCEGRSIRLYRTDASDGVIYTEADLNSPCAILLGNEGSGFESSFSDLPPIRIPIAKGVESLNVATAGAILLFEARRQRSQSKNL